MRLVIIIHGLQHSRIGCDVVGSTCRHTEAHIIPLDIGDDSVDHLNHYRKHGVNFHTIQVLLKFFYFFVPLDTFVEHMLQLELRY